MEPERGAEVESAFALSVVIPVYAGADPRHLERALESVFDQTLPPDEVVVVEDGPLTPAHEQVLAACGRRHASLRRIRLARNGGVAVALQAGVEAAKSPWIARMDADDVSVPDRFEAQMTAIRGEEYDVLGSAMVEFDEDEDLVVGVRRMPEHHDSIVRLMRVNTPLNHPTVVFRRSLVLDVGGYRPLAHLEDYDLWARVWAAGGVLHNLPKPLVRYRAGADMLARRRNRGIHGSELRLQRNLRGYGLTSTPTMVRNIAMRTTFRLLPRPVMRRAYGYLFHDRHTGATRSLR